MSARADSAAARVAKTAGRRASPASVVSSASSPRRTASERSRGSPRRANRASAVVDRFVKIATCAGCPAGVT